MSKLSRFALMAASTVVGFVVLAMVGVFNSVSAQPPATEQAAEPAPPEGQTYTGGKKCASCHFKQYTTWKKTKHATDAFAKLPEKYQADVNCINCHTTGYGQETGFKDIASTPNLAGTSCEACHGPGSEHDKIAKKFAEKKKLSADEEKVARDSIYKILPGNVCSRCHTSQGHKEHPKYDKE